MPLGDADIASGIFFADFGQTVVFCGLTAKGNFDAPGKDAMFERVNVADTEYCLMLGSGTFPRMPKATDRIEVAGNQYQVRSATPLDDGAVIEYKLRAL